MERDGHLKSLAERMKEKAEQERIETEKVFNEQLRALSDSLRESSTNALRTMSDAMAGEITDAAESLNRHYQTLSIAYGKAWIRTALMAFAVLIGMTAGGWTLVKLGAWNLNRYRTDLAQVKAELREQRQALTDTKGEREKAETWGLTFRESENGRFIVMPDGMTAATGWTLGDKAMIKLER